MGYPYMHSSRYFGVLAPNSPIRAAVTAMALPPMVSQATEVAADANTGLGAPGSPPGNVAQPTPAPPKRPAHYLWAVLIARIYEVFPLLCPICGGRMRIIAFITHSADIRQILHRIGVESEAPHIASARGRAPGQTVTRQPPGQHPADQALSSPCRTVRTQVHSLGY